MKKIKLSDFLVFCIFFIAGMFAFYGFGLPVVGYADVTYYNESDQSLVLHATCQKTKHIDIEVQSQCVGYLMYEKVHSGKLDVKSFCKNDEFRHEFKKCQKQLN